MAAVLNQVGQIKDEKALATGTGPYMELPWRAARRADGVFLGAPPHQT
jgi:hypothetical protein